MSVIFLAGVHGVGKGYLGVPVAASLGMAHYTASQLIRDEKGRPTWGNDKLTPELQDNQRALIRAVARHRKSGKEMLLDGHFVLRNAAGVSVRLGEDVFSNLHLSGTILLIDDAKTIAARLLSRDGIFTAPDSIAELATEETAHAHDVCSALKIPLIIVNTPNKAALTNAIIQLLVK